MYYDVGAKSIFYTITYIRENDLNANEIIVEYMSSEYHHADDVWFEIKEEGSIVIGEGNCYTNFC